MLEFSKYDEKTNKRYWTRVKYELKTQSNGLGIFLGTRAEMKKDTENV